jgi:putative aldouronate transport system substrate-binding protein
MEFDHVSRRAFLRRAVLGAALPVLLSACAPTSPPAPTSAPTAAPAPTPAGAGAATATTAPNPATGGAAPGLPAYLPLADKPKPDLPSTGALYEDAYFNYPANPRKALPDTPPGQGGTINAFVVGLFPPPTPFDQNPAWQAVNKALNADVQFNIVGLADYGAKLATIMAGNDLPDLIYFVNGYNAAPNVPTFLQRAMADLTPYLGGDAARDYPNLAAIPTFAWKQSGSVLNGHLLMIPAERYAPGNNILLKNATVVDPIIGADYTPKNADDFKRVLTELNQPAADRYAMAGYVGNPFVIQYFAQMFGAPNNWRLDASGKLVKDFEAPEFRDAVGYVRDLVSANLYRPDSLNIASQTAYRDTFLGGRVAVAVQGFGINWADVWQRAASQNPPVQVPMIGPFAAHDGQQPVHFLGNGFAGATGLKQAGPDRIKELLRVLNWLAAPFGSQEDLLLTYGLPDVHYKLDSSGNPIPQPAWQENVNNMPWRYTAQHPQVIYNAGRPELTRALHDAEQALIPIGVADPTLGSYSPTASAKNVVLTNSFYDALTQVLAGRSSMSDFEQAVKDWQNGGGEQMRAEFQDALAKAQ